MSKQVDTALIDGDIVVYRSGFSAEHTIYTLNFTDKLGKGSVQFNYRKELNEFIKERGIEEYEIEKTVQVEPLANALHTVKKTIGTILANTRAADYKVFLTTGDNYRHENATIAKYKGNRDNQRRPQHYLDIRKYLLKYYGAIECKGIEADDALADAQTDTTVICSIDKDLLQVPGKHYNWVKDVKTMVTPETGLESLWMQVLTGDATDNIPGIKGIGPGTAKKLLADCETAEEYRKACIEEWDKHLYSDSPPDWIVYPMIEDESDNRYYRYWHDENAEVIAEGESIVDEVYNMVKVGT